MNRNRVLLVILTVGALALLAIFRFYARQPDIETDISVPDYYSLARFNYSGDPAEFYRDTYSWYKSIHDKDGVYLVNTSYYSKEILDQWDENRVYKTVPLRPFWVFRVSPSYVEVMGIPLSEASLKIATNGVRLYLIPDTYDEKEAGAIREYLSEDAKRGAANSDIQTVFTRNEEVRFVLYSPRSPYFAWPSAAGEPITAEDPIVFVCTPENMKYFESESLIATGVDSYTKFDNSELARKYSNTDALARYSLSFSSSAKIYRAASRDGIVDAGIDAVFTQALP